MTKHLTPKQEAFAQAIVSGLNASDAYRKAYNAQNMSDKVINNKASGLMKQGDIGVRVKELKDAIEPVIQEKLQVTIESIIDELEAVRVNAMRLNQSSAAVAAIMGKAKLLGFVNDQAQVTANVSVIDQTQNNMVLVNELRRMALEGIDPRILSA